MSDKVRFLPVVVDGAGCQQYMIQGIVPVPHPSYIAMRQVALRGYVVFLLMPHLSLSSRRSSSEAIRKPRLLLSVGATSPQSDHVAPSGVWPTLSSVSGIAGPAMPDTEESPHTEESVVQYTTSVAAFKKRASVGPSLTTRSLLRRKSRAIRHLDDDDDDDDDDDEEGVDLDFVEDWFIPFFLGAIFGGVVVWCCCLKGMSILDGGGHDRVGPS